MLGIFGGSFNPVHIGHLLLAEYIREELKLNKIIFIPAGNPPHKHDDELELSYHRYNMVELAIADNPFFDISDIELKREGVSYTSDTLNSISKENPDEELSFICGSDSIIQLPTWHEIGKIFELSTIIVANRPNVSQQDLDEQITEFKNKYKARIICSTAPHIEVSSSEVRSRIQQGLSIRYIVPKAVVEYIHTNNLFRRE